MDTWTLQGDSYSFLRNSSAPHVISLRHRDGTPNRVEIFDITNIPSHRSAISETTCLCDIFGDDCESRPPSLPSIPTTRALVHPPIPPPRSEAAGPRESSASPPGSPLPLDELDDSTSSYHTASESFEDSSKTLRPNNNLSEPRDSGALATSGDNTSLSPVVPQLESGYKTASPGYCKTTTSSSDSGGSVSSVIRISPAPAVQHCRTDLSPTPEDRYTCPSPKSVVTVHSIEDRDQDSSPGIRDSASSTDCIHTLSSPETRVAQHLPETESVKPSPELIANPVLPDYTESSEPSVRAVTPKLKSPASHTISLTEILPHRGHTAASPEPTNKANSPEFKDSAFSPDIYRRVSIPDLFSRTSTPEVEDSISISELGNHLPPADKHLSSSEETRSASTPVPRYTPPTPVTYSQASSPELRSINSTPDLRSANITPDLRSANITPDLRSANITPELRSANITPELRSANITPVLRSANITPELRSASITPELRSASITPKLRSSSITPELRSASVTPDLRPSNITPDLRSANITPELRSANIPPELSSASITPERRSSSITPEIKSAGFTPDLRPASITPELRSASVTPELRSANITPELRSASITPETRSASPTPEISLANIPSEIRSDSITPELRSASIIPELRSTSITPELSLTAVATELSVTTVTPNSELLRPKSLTPEFRSSDSNSTSSYYSGSSSSDTWTKPSSRTPTTETHYNRTQSRTASSETGYNRTPSRNPSPESNFSRTPSKTPSPETSYNRTPSRIPSPEVHYNKTPSRTLSPESGCSRTPSRTPSSETHSNRTLSRTPSPETRSNSSPSQKLLFDTHSNRTLSRTPSPKIHTNQAPLRTLSPKTPNRTPSRTPTPERNNNTTGHPSEIRNPSAPPPEIRHTSPPIEQRSTAPSPEIRITASTPEIKRRYLSPEVPSQAKAKSLETWINSPSSQPGSSSSHQVLENHYPILFTEAGELESTPDINSHISSPGPGGRTHVPLQRKSTTPTEERINSQSPDSIGQHSSPEGRASNAEPVVAGLISPALQTPEITDKAASPELPGDIKLSSEYKNSIASPDPRYTTPSPQHRYKDPLTTGEVACSSTELNFTTKSPGSPAISPCSPAVSNPLEQNIFNGTSKLLGNHFSHSSKEALPTEKSTKISSSPVQNQSALDHNNLSAQTAEIQNFSPEIRNISPEIRPSAPCPFVSIKGRSSSVSPDYEGPGNLSIQRVGDLESKHTALSLTPEPSDTSSQSTTTEHPGTETNPRNKPIEKLTEEDMAHCMGKGDNRSPPLTRFTPVHIIPPSPRRPRGHWGSRSYSLPETEANDAIVLSENLIESTVKTVTSGASPSLSSDESENIAYDSQAYEESLERGDKREHLWEMQERDRKIWRDEAREKERASQKEEDRRQRAMERHMQKEMQWEEPVPGNWEGREGEASNTGEQVDLSFTARNRKELAHHRAALISKESQRGIPAAHLHSESLLANRLEQIHQQQHGILHRAAHSPQTDTARRSGPGPTKKLQPQPKTAVPQLRSPTVGYVSDDSPGPNLNSKMDNELDSEEDSEVKWFSDVAFRSLSSGSPQVDYLDMYNSSHCSSTGASQPSTQDSPAGANAVWLAYADLSVFAPRLDNEDFSATHQQQLSCGAYYPPHEGLDPSNKYEMGSFECVDVVVEKDEPKKVRRGVPKRQIQLKRKNTEVNLGEKCNVSPVMVPSPVVAPVVLMDSPLLQRHNREALQRQHSTPVTLQETYCTESAAEKTQRAERKGKLQKSISLDGTCAKTKMATCLIKTVLSKKMQNVGKQTDEEEERHLSPSVEHNPLSDQDMSILKESPKPETQNINSSLNSNHTWSSEELASRRETNTNIEVNRQQRCFGTKPTIRPTNQTHNTNFTSPHQINSSPGPNSITPEIIADLHSASATSLLSNNKINESGVRSPNSWRTDMVKPDVRSDLVFPFDSKKNRENVNQMGGKQTDEKDDKHGSGLADAHSKTSDITIKPSAFTEKKTSSLNISLTPELETKPVVNDTIDSFERICQRETRVENWNLENAHRETVEDEKKVEALNKTNEQIEKVEEDSKGKAKAPMHKVRDVRKLVKNKYNLSFKAVPEPEEDKQIERFERSEEQREERSEERGEERREEWYKDRHEGIEQRRDENIRENLEKRKEETLPPHPIFLQKVEKSMSRPKPIQIECKAISRRESKTECKMFKDRPKPDSLQQVSTETAREPERPVYTTPTSCTTNAALSETEPSQHNATVVNTVETETDQAKVKPRHTESQRTSRRQRSVSESDKPEVMRRDAKPPMLGSSPKIPSKDRGVSNASLVLQDGSSKVKSFSSSAPVSPAPATPASYPAHAASFPSSPATTPDPIPASSTHSPAPTLAPTLGPKSPSVQASLSNPTSSPGPQAVLDNPTPCYSVSLLMKEKGYQADIGSVVSEVVSDAFICAGEGDIKQKHINRIEIPLQTHGYSDGVNSYSDRQRTYSSSSTSSVKATAFVSPSSPVQDASSLLSSSHVKDSSSVLSSSPVKDASSLLSSSPVQDASSVLSSSPVKDASSVLSSSHVKDSLSVLSSSPVKDASSLLSLRPVKDASSVLSSSPVIDASSVLSSSPVTDASGVISSSPVKEALSISSTSVNASTSSFSNSVNATASSSYTHSVPGSPRLRRISSQIDESDRNQERVNVRATVRDIEQRSASPQQQKKIREENAEKETVQKSTYSPKLAGSQPRSPAPMRRYRPQAIEVRSLSKEIHKQDKHETTTMSSSRPQPIEVCSIASGPPVAPKPKFKLTDVNSLSSEIQQKPVEAAMSGFKRHTENERSVPNEKATSAMTIQRQISSDSTPVSNYSKKLSVSAVSSYRPPPTKTTIIASFSHKPVSTTTTDTETNERSKHPGASFQGQGQAPSSTQRSTNLPDSGPAPTNVQGSTHAPVRHSSQSADVTSNPQHPKTTTLTYTQEQAMPVIFNHAKQPAAVSTAAQAPRYTHHIQTHQPTNRPFSGERSLRADDLHFYASDDPPSYDERESFSPLQVPELPQRRPNRYHPTSSTSRPPPCSCTLSCPSHPSNSLSPPNHHYPTHSLTPPDPSHSPGQPLPYSMGAQPPLRSHQCRADLQPLSSMGYQHSSPKSSTLHSHIQATQGMYQSMHQPSPHPSVLQPCPPDRPLQPPQHMDPRRGQLLQRSPQVQPPVSGGPYSDHSHSPNMPSMDPQYLCSPQSLGPSYGSEYGSLSGSDYPDSAGGLGYGQTPRRVLMDPDTGKYFYIEMPVQPLRKMLFDPETGQYVEVLIPQSTLSHTGLYPASAAPYSPASAAPYPSIHNPNMYAPAPQYLPYGPPPPVPHSQAQSQPPRHPEAPAPVMMHHKGPQVSYSSPGSKGSKPEPQSHAPLDQSYLESMYYVPTGMTASPPDYFHKQPSSLPNAGGKRA